MLVSYDSVIHTLIELVVPRDDVSSYLGMVEIEAVLGAKFVSCDVPAALGAHQQHVVKLNTHR